MTFRRYYANFAPQLTLASGINNSVGSLTVSASFAGWPAQTPFYAVLEYGTGNSEIVQVTAVSTSTATIVRGQDGSSAVSHAAGATLDAVIVRADMDDANAHINSTSNVHGVAGNVTGTSDVQTLTNKTIQGGSLTGTINAPATFNGSPVVNTPTVNAGTFVNTSSAPAMTVKQSASGESQLVSWQNNAGVEKGSVDSSGNVTATKFIGTFSGPGSFATGDIKMTATLALEAGWLDCDGSAVSRSTYAALYAALCKAEKTGSLASSGSAGNWTGTLTVASTTGWAVGDRVSVGPGFNLTTGVVNPGDPNANVITSIPNGTTILFHGTSTASPFTATTSQTYAVAPFGNGDGSTTFNVPDLRDKFVRGANMSPTTVGNTGGANTHSHPLSDAGQAEVITGGTSIVSRNVATSATWTSTQRVVGTNNATMLDETTGAALTGTTDAASTLPAYSTLRPIIKT